MLVIPQTFGKLYYLWLSLPGCINMFEIYYLTNRSILQWMMSLQMCLLRSQEQQYSGFIAILLLAVNIRSSLQTLLLLASNPISSSKEDKVVGIAHLESKTFGEDTVCVHSHTTLNKIKTHWWVFHSRQHELNEGCVEGGVQDTLLSTLHLQTHGAHLPPETHKRESWANHLKVLKSESHSWFYS